MNRVRLALATTVFGVAAIPLHGQAKTDPCPMKFSVTTKDALGNIDSGLPPGDEKWLGKFLKQHYEGMCYVTPSPDVKILLSITISTQDETVVPRVRSVPVYTLQILDARNGKPKIIRTFQRSKAGTSEGRVPGIIANISNPERGVILDAIDWIAKANLDLSTEPTPEEAQPAGPKS